ncbi:hypothetical protein P692DRAFT_20828079 [Suillus brevipes Sb2]|nr:hypothetical protein P692DRAFT_20828079 [Suillus brevipes Sb2]
MFAKFTAVYVIACFAALAFASPVPVAAPAAVALANTEFLAVSLFGFDTLIKLLMPYFCSVKLCQ